jgi:hypothetical protein
MTPDLQGYAGQCTLGSLAPRLLGQRLLRSHVSTPLDAILYRLWPATCCPISTDPSPLLSVDFPCGPLSFPSSSYIAGYFRLVTQSAATAGSSLADFSTLKMEAICSTETLAHTRSTRRHISEDGILHSNRRENLRSYIMFKTFSGCLIYRTNVLISNVEGMYSMAIALVSSGFVQLWVGLSGVQAHISIDSGSINLGRESEDGA